MAHQATKKQKRCKGCGQFFVPSRSLQTVCGMQCAIDVTKADRERQYKKLTRKMRSEFNQTDRKWLTKKAQEACNAYVRERDKNLGCISCGTKSAGQYHAGHYKSVGHAPELRFHWANIHKQCAQCNNFKSGDIAAYRCNLIDRVGQDMVDYIEGPHQSQKLTIDDLQNIIQWFKGQKKALNE